MPEFAVPTVFSVVDHLNPFFAKGAAGATRFETMVKGAFARTGHQASMFNSILGGVTFGNLAADGIRRGIQGIQGLAREGLALASNLVEVQNVVDTSFGSMSGQIDRWSKTAITGFGLSELQAKQFAGTMGAMLKSSGLAGQSVVDMSIGLTALAGDFSSFYNLDPGIAFQKIRAGISGETEPLKQLGINMSVANMQAFALTQGIKKKWAVLSQGEQAQLRYAYLMKVSADAQGDFSKTLATSVANQQRVYATNRQQLAASAMNSLLPLQLKYYQLLNSTVSKAGEWIEANKGLIATRIDTFFDRAGQFLTAIKPGLSFVLWAVKNLAGPVLAGAATFTVLKYGLLAAAAAGKVFGLVNTILFAYQAYAGGAATAQEALNMVMNANPVGLVVTGISILVGLFVLLASKVGGVSPAFTVLGQTMMKGLLAPVNLVIDGFQMLMLLASKLPGQVGQSFAAGYADIQAFQQNMNSTLTGSSGSYDFATPYQTAREKKLEREAPNEAAIERQDSSWSGYLQVAAPAGSTMEAKSTGPAQLRYDLMGANP